MKMKSPSERSQAVSAVPGEPTSIASSAVVAVERDDLDPRDDRDVRARPELVDQVAGHALLEPVAAAEDRHRARVPREEQRRLARPSCPRRRCGCPARACPPRRSARRRTRRPCPRAARTPSTASRRHATPHARMIVRARRTSPPSRWTWRVVGVDPHDLARDEDLGAEPARLAQRAARELVARHAFVEAEVVLDPRRRARLPARRLALDDDRAAGPPRRRTPRRRARPGPRRRRRCRTRRPSGSVPRPSSSATRRSCGRTTVLPSDDADHRAVVRRRERAAPLLGRVRLVRLEPRERDLVAVEEPAQIGARAVEATPDDDRPRRRRLRGDALQPARPRHPVRREPPDLLADVRRHRGDRVVVVRLDPHHARRLGRAEADGKDRAERDRHLAEDVSQLALADDPLDAVDQLDRLDPPLEHREERALRPLVRRVLALHEADVGGGPREPLAVRRVEPGEDRHAADVVLRDHDPTLLRRPPTGPGMYGQYARPVGEASFEIEIDGGILRGHRGGTGAPALLLHGGPAVPDYMGDCAGCARRALLHDPLHAARNAAVGRAGRRTAWSRTWRTPSPCSTRSASTARGRSVTPGAATSPSTSVTSTRIACSASC